MIGNARDFLAMRDAGEDFTGFVRGSVGGMPIVGDGRHALPRSAASEALSASLMRRALKVDGGAGVYAWIEARGVVDDREARRLRRQAS